MPKHQFRFAPLSNRGWITTLEAEDHHIVKNAMETQVPPLKSAGIFPPAHILERFASYFPAKTPFSYIVFRLHDIAAITNSFHLCDLREQIQVCDIIQPYSLSINDRIIFMAAPVFLRDFNGIEVLAELATMRGQPG